VSAALTLYWSFKQHVVKDHHDFVALLVKGEVHNNVKTLMTQMGIRAIEIDPIPERFFTEEVRFVMMISGIMKLTFVILRYVAASDTEC